MAITPDRHPGPLKEWKVSLSTTDDVGAPVGDPAEAGAFTYHGGSWAFKDGIGVFNPRTSANAAGSDKQIQFNDGGTAFAGCDQLVWDKVNHRLGLNCTPTAKLHVANTTDTYCGLFTSDRGAALVGAVTSSDAGSSGVYGTATAGHAGLFEATTGYGIMASATSGTAGYFSSTSGTAVYAVANGDGPFAVYGYNSVSGGVAICGVSTGTGYGLNGTTATGRGVNAYASGTGTAVWANSVGGSGVIGESFHATNAVKGIWGVTSSSSQGSSGVYGQATYGAGVSGYASESGATGCYGNAPSGYGIAGTTATGSGVYGSASGSGYGGYFTSASGYGLIVNAGNVGIGNTSPSSYKFMVSGDIYASGEFRSEVGGDDQGFEGRSGSLSIFSMTRESDDLKLSSYSGIQLWGNAQSGIGSGSCLVKMLYDGKVGINCTPSLGKLHVSTTGAGIYCATSSTTVSDFAVRGVVSGVSGQTWAVRGENSSATNYSAGVSGMAYGSSGIVWGVHGYVQDSTTAGAAGVLGECNTAGDVAGVRGYGQQAYGVIAQGHASGGSYGRAALRIVPQTSLPTVGQVGDLAVVSAILYICTSTTPTWTKVGTQT